jgi:hypothetical protein
VIDLPPFDALALSLHHSPGVHAILVGSGLSRAAGIPTGWEITIDLIRRLAALDGVAEHDDWVQWYRNKYSEGPGYSKILGALASTSAERRAILQSYIDPPEGEDLRKPTKAHHAIAQLVASGAVRVVITTNFDRLIENALREAGVEPTVIAGDDAVAGATPLVHSKCTVIKVHGDYLDARIKNTDAELEDYSEAMNALLDQVFDNFGLFVVGWSGEWDTALRSAILRAPSRRYPLYWASRGNVGGLAQDLLEQRGGRSFPITDADNFFVKLCEALGALRQASRPHPRSVELAVGLAKRYCRDDKLALEWAEFLHSEVEGVRQFVTGPDYPMVSPAIKTLNDIVNTFMVRTEVLRRACLICGRWGTPDANQAVARAIESLSFGAEPLRGTVSTTCLALREFGASVCFYWNMAGLLDRKDWVAVRTLQKLEIKQRIDNTDAVIVLPFSAYGTDWKFLTGLERHHTAASDFLAAKFVSEAPDIALSERRAEELFDQTELAIALGYVHKLLLMEPARPIGMPVGRFCWKSRGETFEADLKRIEELSDSDAFFEAGMLGGSQAMAAPTLQKIREIRRELDRYGW